MASAYTIRVEGEDHELLVVDGLELVRGFRAESAGVGVSLPPLTVSVVAYGP